MVRRRQAIQSLQSKGYRDAYVEEHISQGLAFQIRATREDRGWTQGELAERTGQRQPVISKLEDPDYGNYTISTLKRLASAFDVAVIIRFGPFSELVDYTTNLSQENLAPPSFEDDAALKVSQLPVSTAQSLATTSFNASIMCFVKGTAQGDERNASTTVVLPDPRMHGTVRDYQVKVASE